MKFHSLQNIKWLYVFILSTFSVRVETFICELNACIGENSSGGDFAGFVGSCRQIFLFHFWYTMAERSKKIVDRTK